MSVTIVDLLLIDVVGGFMDVKYQYTRNWFDARVTYQNLKVDSNLNVLSQDDRNKLWFPYAIHNNIGAKELIKETEVRDIWKNN